MFKSSIGFRRNLFRRFKAALRASQAKSHHESLKKALPDQWATYQEYCDDWALLGIYRMQLQSFVDFLDAGEPEFKYELSHLLSEIGLTAEPA